MIHCVFRIPVDQSLSFYVVFRILLVVILSLFVVVILSHGAFILSPTYGSKYPLVSSTYRTKGCPKAHLDRCQHRSVNQGMKKSLPDI